VTLRTLSVFDQRFAFGDAAWRHIGDEAGMRVPDFRAERIFRNCKDAMSDGFRTSVGVEYAMTARGGDVRR
jgi:hypothetical protein